MSQLVDKSIILLLCFGISSIFIKDIDIIICTLIVVTISSFISFFQKKKVAKILIVMALLLCLVYPPFCVFLPLIYYDISNETLYKFGIVGIISVLQVLRLEQPYLFLYMFLMVVTSILLQYRSNKAIVFEEQWKKTRDNSEEVTLALKNRNKELREKQEYEIHMATLKERNRIAREIHDNVGHMLSRSILQVGALQAINQDTVIKENLEALNTTLTEAMDSIRKSVHDLHDDSIDLYATIQNICKDFSQYEIELDYDMEEDCDKAVKYCFITTIKEALSNMVKHSNAAKMEIVLREHPAMYQLLIKDNGTNQKKITEDGIGLENMRERVQALKGTFNINREQGFRIFIVIPKE